MVEARGAAHVEIEELEPEEQADELLLMGLRLTEGIEVSRWQALSGRPFDSARERDLIANGFLERLGNDRIRCTPAGMLILDAVVADLAI
jgi:coproporphyrinogen III oxidase-like Fe-S oxidoreductase